MSEPSYEVKIPNIMNPFTVEVNGNTYSFPAGTTQEVNQEVYDVIRNIESMVPTPNPRAGEPSFESLRDKPFYSETVMGDTLVVGIDPKYLPKGGFGYEYIGELLPESLCTFSEEMDMMHPLSSALGLKVGGSYTVTWNGTEYTCEGTTFDMDSVTCIAIGDANLYVTGEPSGEYPFLIFDIPAEMTAQIGMHAAVLGSDGSESAMVSVSGNVVSTIDPKFLPGGGVLLYADDSGCLYKSDVLSEENAVSMDEVLGYAKKGMTVVVTPYAVGERTDYQYAITIIKITTEEPNYARVLTGGDSYYHSKERVVNDAPPT